MGGIPLIISNEDFSLTVLCFGMKYRSQTYLDMYAYFLQLVGVLSPKLALCMLNNYKEMQVSTFCVYFEDFFIAICNLWCVFLVLPVLWWGWQEFF